MKAVSSIGKLVRLRPEKMRKNWLYTVILSKGVGQGKVYRVRYTDSGWLEIIEE
jgi:hypothetical protein